MNDYKSMTAEHISANLKDYEAARSGFFNLILDSSVNDVIKATYKGDHAEATTEDRYARAQEIITLNVVKATVPNWEAEVLRYTRGNEEVKFAGKPKFNDGSITVDDVVGLDTKGILHALHAKVYDVYSRKGGRMVDYKFNATLVEYTQDYEPIRQWRIYGAWIPSLEESEFNKENDDKRQIVARIVYDRAEPQEVNKI